MAHFQLPLIQHFAHGWREIQQAQQVADRGARFADNFRKRFVGEAVVLQKTFQGRGFFKGVEILALDVLDQCQRRGLFVIDIAHHRRHGCQASALRRSPAPFAGDDLEAAFRARADDDGFDDALGAYRLCQFFDALVTNAIARLMFARRDALDGDFRNRRCGPRCERRGRLWRFFFVLGQQQRVQASP